MIQPTGTNFLVANILEANGAFFEVTGNHLGGVRETNLVTLKPLSEHAGSVGRYTLPEVPVPAHILEAAVLGGMKQYVPMDVFEEQRKNTQIADLQLRECGERYQDLCAKHGTIHSDYNTLMAKLEQTEAELSSEKHTALQYSAHLDWLEAQYKETAIILTGFSTLPPSIADLPEAARMVKRELTAILEPVHQGAPE